MIYHILGVAVIVAYVPCLAILFRSLANALPATVPHLRKPPVPGLLDVEVRFTGSNYVGVV